jgi:hypothetical protein
MFTDDSKEEQKKLDKVLLNLIDYELSLNDNAKWDQWIAQEVYDFI